VNHKTIVESDAVTWREFKGLCATRGTTVQAELGRLVQLAVTKHRRDQAATIRRRDKAAQSVQRAVRELGS
jgi:hypothetical protein